jgi:oligoendopeptidase F
VFAAFVARPGLAESRPRLERIRAERHFRLARAEQSLYTELEREALHGWGRLYDLVSGRLEADVTHPDGRSERLAIAVVNAMRGSSDAHVRRAAFDAQQAAWRGVADVCAHTLTQIVGVRQTRYDRLGIDEIAVPTAQNRLRPETLAALWAAADAARPALHAYLRHKAKHHGVERLAWCDYDAPLPTATEVPEAELSWGDAVDQVVDAFRSFSPELARFARRACDARWVDALARPGRRQGGYCAFLPRTHESRIFLTFHGSVDHAITLAHELGHAWHNEVLEGVSPQRRNLTMSLAESASTFGEAVFRQGLLDRAPDAAHRAAILDQQLGAGVAFLMNIPFRYQLERRLYTLRREGNFLPSVLCAETDRLQREIYGDTISSTDPYFWASKLHFYISSRAFYNWPYTFGYLFSSHLHARAKAEGAAFLPVLTELLRRTGWQQTEDLAAEVLGVDLTDPAFWVEAARPLTEMSAEFQEIAPCSPRHA